MSYDMGNISPTIEWNTPPTRWGMPWQIWGSTRGFAIISQGFWITNEKSVILVIGWGCLLSYASPCKVRTDCLTILANQCSEKDFIDCPQREGIILLTLPHFEGQSIKYFPFFKGESIKSFPIFEGESIKSFPLFEGQSIKSFLLTSTD